MYQSNYYGCQPAYEPSVDYFVRNFTYNPSNFYTNTTAYLNAPNPLQVSIEYVSNNSASYQTINYSANQTIIHNPEVFLNPIRATNPVIQKITPALKRKIDLIFRLTTNYTIPEDLLISILNAKEFKERGFSHNVQGFAINRRPLLSSVFVKQNPLDELMLTIGHEIGHCLSFPIKDIIMEEAKAFAFEIAWMKTIHKFNVMNLRQSMNLHALRPGTIIHNQALDFVLTQLRLNTLLQVFSQLCLIIQAGF